jgi:hypothetical protein
MEAAMISGSTLPGQTKAVPVLRAARYDQPGGNIPLSPFSSGAIGGLSVTQSALAQQSYQVMTLGQSLGSTVAATLSNAPLAQGTTIYKAHHEIVRAYLDAYKRALAISSGNLTPSGTVARPWKPVEVPAQPTYYSTTSIVVQWAAAEEIYDTVQAFYLSPNKPRDRQIAERITALYRAALEEGEHILPTSLNQFTEFLLENKDLGFPRITLTPDGTIRVRWIRGEGDFVAIEFTGEPDAKLVTEMPGLVPPMRFTREPLASVIAAVKAMGGSFT